MIPRYAVLAGGVVREVAWADGVFPTEAMIAAARARRDGAVPAVLAVVSPNNPTGCVATAEDLRRVSAAAPNALLMVDLAYTEFAEEDLTAFALGLPNAVVIRTFSKAYGLAGLRVGYAASRNTRVIDALRAAGHPYPCSAWSVWAAGRALAVRPEGVRERAARAARERTLIGSALRGVGAVVPEGAGSSRANFVLARHPRCASLWEGLLARGVLVKRWTGRAGLEDALRITCPLEDRGCDAVVRAIADTGAQLEQRR
jgi:histidinol-phosphate aminotransferase